MRGRKRHVAAFAAVLVAVAVTCGAFTTTAGARTTGEVCASGITQGGTFSGRLLYGPPGVTFATQLTTTITNDNVLPWWGTVTVNGLVSKTMYLLPSFSSTIVGPGIIGRQYVSYSVSFDPISDATQLFVHVCA